MEDIHKTLSGRKQTEMFGQTKLHTMEAIADTGCQTCTAGQDILLKLGGTLDNLVRTKHKIVGITDVSLKIVGALMLSISYNGHTTRQMVHMSTNIDGLYLCQNRR